MEEDFTKIYAKNTWGAGSGTGSNPNYCKDYLAYLKTIVTGKVVLDLGCGDWQMYADFDWSIASAYIGVDIVANLIERHKVEHPEFTFVHANFNQPEVFSQLCATYKPDIILIKDVVHHWTDDELDLWADSLPSAEFKTIIVAGDYRYFRSPWKNGGPRDLANKYRWAPIDMTLYGFEHVMYFPRGRYKQVVKLEKVCS